MYTYRKIGEIEYVCTQLRECDIFDNLEHFCQGNEYDKIDWLLLIVLDKVEKEKIKLKI